MWIQEYLLFFYQGKPVLGATLGSVWGRERSTERVMLVTVPGYHFFSLEWLALSFLSFCAKLVLGIHCWSRLVGAKTLASRVLGGGQHIPNCWRDVTGMGTLLYSDSTEY